MSDEGLLDRVDGGGQSALLPQRMRWTGEQMQPTVG